MSAVGANYAIRFCHLQDVSAKMVLTVLAWKAKPETPDIAYMTNEQLRLETGLKSVNGVKLAIRRLVAAGEVHVVAAGGRGQATNYELLGVRRWLKACEVSQFDISNGDTKASDYDDRCHFVTVNRHDLTPIDYKTNKYTKDKGADAPAAAISSPSPPSLGKQAPKPKKAHAPKFDPKSIPLPHGPGFAAAWSEFAQHRREKKAPMTPTAAAKLLKKLSAVNERQAIEALDRSVANGWTGVFPDKPADEPKVVAIPTGPRQPNAFMQSLAYAHRKESAA